MTNIPTLRILLLGAPTVYYDNRPLQIQRRLMRWMLFYLACQKEMVGRSDLILLFWPDAGEEDARRHLRETLSKLRAQLPDPDLLITEQDRVGLDPQRIYSDVQEFTYLVSQTARACSQTPAATPLTQAVYKKVLQAVRLWRSARFFAGASLPESEMLNNWLLATSQQLENQHQRLLERLADHDIASGDVESALTWLQSALEGDETNETLHFRLLSLLNTQGRYSEALNYCTYLQDLFRREGFGELPPALLSLSRKIREVAAQPDEALDHPAWPTLADIQVPFIGRQELLRELQFAVRRSGPVILFGEAGAGKSRTVRELFFSLKPAPRLLMAPARIMENSLPFQPLIDLLRHNVKAEEWKQMDLTWVTSLSELLPELPILRPEIQPLRISPSQQQYNLLFEALHQVLLFLGKKKPFLLFLDNAQWCDRDTFSALAYLAERSVFFETGTLIMAARPETPAPQLTEFLNRPSNAFSVQRLSLPPLNSEEITGLARSVLGEAYREDILPRLERETGGNPLFVLETLRMVLDYSFDANISSALERLPLAGSILAIIRERLQHLSPNSAQVLSTAAVIAEVAGGEFALDLLEDTCMLPPEQIAQSIESLVQSNLIRAVLKDRRSSGYMFTHEKIREVVLLDLSPARRRLFHLRIARALEQKPQGQSTDMEAALAAHYEEAGELDAAIQHWLKAALYAWQLYDKDRSVAALKHAEQILTRLGHQASDLLIYQVYRQWGRMAYDLYDPTMIEQIYDRLLQSGQKRQNPLLAGSAYNGLAQADELRTQPNQGLVRLEKANRYLEQIGRLFEHIEAATRQALFQMQLGHYTDAQAGFQKALELGDQAIDIQSVEARSLTEYWLANLLTITGWPLLALEMAERSYRDAEDTFNQGAAARALSVRAAAKYHLGRYPQSLDDALQGLSTAEATRVPLLIGKLRGSAAYSCLAMGYLDACWEHAQAAITIAEQYPYAFLKEDMQCLLGKLFYFLGAFDRAAEMHQMGCQANVENFHVIDNQISLLLAQAALSGQIPGVAMIDPLVNQTTRKGLLAFALPAQLVKAMILGKSGQVDEARGIIELVRSETRSRFMAETGIHALLIQAQMAENMDQAISLYQAAVEAAENTGHRLLELDSCMHWQKAARQAHQDEKLAQSHFNDLRTLLCQHTAIPELNQLLMKKLVSVDNLS